MEAAMDRHSANESAMKSAPWEHRTGNTDHHQEIRELAYALWILRGKPIGSPDFDWYRAEAELKAKRSAARAA
jgi:hypothetical protein